jgi:hypothetical protein
MLQTISLDNPPYVECGLVKVTNRVGTYLHHSPQLIPHVECGLVKASNPKACTLTYIAVLKKVNRLSKFPIGGGYSDVRETDPSVTYNVC